MTTFSNDLYVKQRIFKKEDLPCKIFKLNITNDIDDSFLSSVLYGPTISKLNLNDRTKKIQEEKKSILEKISLQSFFGMDNGTFSLRKLKDYLQVFFYGLSVESDVFQKSCDEFNFEKQHIVSLYEILTPEKLKDCIEMEFVPRCFSEYESNLDGEHYQQLFSSAFVELILDKYKKEIEILQIKKEIPSFSNDQFLKYLTKFEKSLQNLFLFITEECFREIMLLLQNDGGLVSVDDYFCIYQEFIDFNILILNENLELVSSIDYGECMDVDKKYTVVIRHEDGSFSSVYGEYTYKNGFHFFQCEPSFDMELFDTKVKEIVDEDVPTDETKVQTFHQTVSDAHRAHRNIKEYIQSSVKRIEKDHTDISFDKKTIYERQYFFDHSHAFIKFLLDK